MTNLQLGERAENNWAFPDTRLADDDEKEEEDDDD